MATLQDYLQKAILYRTNALKQAESDSGDSKQAVTDFWNQFQASHYGGSSPDDSHTFNPANFNLAKARAMIDNSHLKGGGGGNYTMRNVLGLLGGSDATGLSDHDVWELYQKGFGTIPEGIANPYAKTSTNNNTNTMNYTDNQKIVQDLFGSLLGRQAADEGMSYFTDRLDKGDTVEDLTRAIKSGSEFKNRSSVVDAYRAANNNANPTEAYLDARVSPGGGTLDPNNPDAAPQFAADNTWSSPLMTKGNNDYKDELKLVVDQLGGYNTAPNKNLGAVQIGTTHDATGKSIIPGGNVDITPVTDGPKPWHDGYASGEEWLAANPQGGSSGGGMDEFMKFMMLMAVMPRGGGGGGYGGSQYGYGGLNPGGVQAAYNPWENVKTGWNFMKDNFGSGASTATVNTQ